MKQPIIRNTKVISVSFDPSVADLMDKARSELGQSRSAFMQSLVKHYSEDRRWEQLFEYGEKTAKRMKITSEEDIDRILHEA